MTKTNFVHPKGWRSTRVLYTALTGVFMFLLLMTSAPTFGQALPEFVDSDVAISRIEARLNAAWTGTTGLENYYSNKYGKDEDAAAVEIQFSYILHESVMNHIKSGKSTRDAVLYVYTKDNIDPDANASTSEVLFAGRYDSMRNRIVREEIVELLKR